MESYLLKFSACLAILMLFYKLVLERENMHVMKRYYLISSILISIIIPFITITFYVETPLIKTEEMIPVPFSEEQDSVFNLSSLIWNIYFLGVIIFGTIFLRNLILIIYRIKKNPHIRSSIFINVLLKENIIPHTFFNFLFFNKKRFENQLIPEEIIIHEKTHAIQKHSIDILILEIIQVIFWFHPLVYILKHFIKLNHEFLADKAVIDSGSETSCYQQLLLSFSSNEQNNPLANAINFSLIKKRFTVMKSKTTKRSIFYRSLFLIPLLALLLLSFSTKVEVQKEIANEDGSIGVIDQDGATKKQIAEYNALAKKYNAQTKENRIIKLKDLKKMEYIYQLMTDQQKKNAEPFPECIPPPPPPPPPAPLNDVNGINPAPSAVDAVDAPLPPPPPLPENATKEQIKKYKMAMKKYEESQKKYLKEKLKN